MTTIKYTKGWKYQLYEQTEFQLHHDFSISGEHQKRFYRVTPDGLLTVYAGCCWDGPTWFPDFKWMMQPSLIHDILHWLIASGVIPESENDLIDKELAYWIRQNEGWDWLYNFRARYVRRATNLAYQKAGDTKEVHEA